jgi:asparagine synthase (glutamine-hydrolysing)
MSVQFGRWNVDGRPLDRRYLNEAASLLSPYGPDAQTSYVAGNIALLCFAFHVTKESRRETQPHVTQSGDVITWDGILDNREQLSEELRLAAPEELSDVSIVAAAWAQWGANSFARLMGDWALAVWNPTQQTLFLAKDFLGTRHLYYSLSHDDVTWSSVLDPLVVLAGRPFQLDEEYVAGWLSHFPAAHLTPFVGVNAVLPARYVQVQNGTIKTTKYWDFRAIEGIRYPTDNDYEEHFRAVLETSLLRRLRSDRPILAELSGGMDSSSIVCVADRLVTHGCAPGTRVDTVSYYQDGEPAWDERPYIAVVEKMRGRVGCHIDVSTHTLLGYGYDSTCPELTPVSRGVGSESVKQLARCIAANENRVVLSGFGGDEVLGGAPSFLPQLADLFVAARFRALARQLRAWALSNRTTVIALLGEVARQFLPKSLPGTCRETEPVPWLDASFLAAHRAAFSRYQASFSLFRVQPSTQEKLETVDALRRQIASFVQTAPILGEKRYPYLDRDLVEFLFAIPGDQLQRPGQRRSLMRRALAGIVPDELLNRKRKAFIARQPLLDIMSHWSPYQDLADHSILVGLHVIDRRRLLDSLGQAKAGNIIPLPLLAHAVVLEKWLKHIQPRGFLTSLPSCPPPGLRVGDRQAFRLS